MPKQAHRHRQRLTLRRQWRWERIRVSRHQQWAQMERLPHGGNRQPPYHSLSLHDELLDGQRCLYRPLWLLLERPRQPKGRQE
jgi:hypothetical protein